MFQPDISWKPYFVSTPADIGTMQNIGTSLRGNKVDMCSARGNYIPTFRRLAQTSFYVPVQYA
jgi:hypothetical protein